MGGWCRVAWQLCPHALPTQWSGSWHRPPFLFLFLTIFLILPFFFFCGTLIIIGKKLYHPAAPAGIVGRARTGCGKTLGFTLPIVELLLREQKGAGALQFGRHPNTIVLLPTRELAKQVGWGARAGGSGRAPPCIGACVWAVRGARTWSEAFMVSPQPPWATSVHPPPAPVPQVCDVFEKLGKAAALSVLCVYGGTPYEAQVGPALRLARVA